ncbi:MAG: hypothetical protein ABW133_19630, partial [Polyangiaceae bacterium]
QADRCRADRVAQELAAAREEVDLLRERCRTFDERISDEEARRALLETRLEQSKNDPEKGALRDKLRGTEDRVRGAEDRVRGAEDRVRGAEEKLRAAEQRSHAADEKLRQAEDKIRQADEKLRQADDKVRSMEERMRAVEERAKSSEVAVKATIGEHESDISKLEAQLRERGQEIQSLRDEVDRRDKLVRELVMTNFPPPGLTISNGAVTAGENGSREASNGPHVDASGGEGAQEPPRIADLSARLDRMATDAARREADLVGARWRIAQLERELTQQR